MPETELPDIIIPTGLLPADGRFGSGPSKVRAEAVASLSLAAQGPLGTSHRQKPVRSLVGRLRAGLAELFGLPEGYEVVLGNGGTTAFWDIATFCLIERRSQHLSFGEFSAKFAAAAKAAPWLDDPDVVTSPAGTHPSAIGRSGIDLYALTHNETSTGVMMEIRRPDGADPGALVAVDATSAAAGLRVDAREFDAYYFAPQKGFASDGGLWIALLSPAAVARVGQLAGPGSTRFVPAFLGPGCRSGEQQARPDLQHSGRRHPVVGRRPARMGTRKWWPGVFCRPLRPLSRDPLRLGRVHGLHGPVRGQAGQRSHVVGTIDFDASVDAAVVARVLRANGIVDTEPYRKLGRNQLRVAMFPAIEPDRRGRPHGLHRPCSGRPFVRGAALSNLSLKRGQRKCGPASGGAPISPAERDPQRQSRLSTSVTYSQSTWSWCSMMTGVPCPWDNSRARTSASSSLFISRVSISAPPGREKRYRRVMAAEGPMSVIWR